MKTAMFVDETARERIAGWFEQFRLALPFQTESRTVDTPQGRTHVLMAGPPDAQPLVCLHGALASSAHLLAELGPLVGRYRLIAVDVMGQSPMTEDRRLELDDDSYATWLSAVVDALGLDRFALLGVSWGGFVAMRMARFAPARLRALVLLVPAGVVSGSAWVGFREVGWPMMMYRLSPSPRRLERALSGLFSTPDPRWTAYFGDALTSYRFDMRVPPLARPTDTAGWTGPTLVMAGDGDVQFPGAPLLARARELFPQAQTHLLENCRHCPPTDEAFRAANGARIQAFLEHEPAAAAAE